MQVSFCILEITLPQLTAVYIETCCIERQVVGRKYKVMKQRLRLCLWRPDCPAHNLEHRAR